MISRTLVFVMVLAVLLAACSFRPVLAPVAYPQSIGVGEVTTNNDVTTEFHFTVSPIKVMVEFTLTGGGSLPQWHQDLDVGIYTIRQTVPSGWALKDISCQGATQLGFAGGEVFAVGSLGVASYEPQIGEPWTVNLADHSVTINLLANEYVNCTFTNDPAPAVGAPVGGFVESINKLAVVGPYFALVGLIAAAAVAAVAVNKKHENRHEA